MARRQGLSGLGPLVDLRLHTPRLDLRLPDDEELAELRQIAAHGVSSR